MIQLQSILLPTPQVCDVSEIYYHEKKDTIDFDGYFNVFYIEKRKKYTNIDTLMLTIKLCGFQKLTLMHNRQEIQSIELIEKEEKIYTVEFPYKQFDDGVFWFSLLKGNGEYKTVIEGYYETDITKEFCRQVNIGIDICTFRRESYVARNLLQLTERILHNDALDVSQHLRIYVIDNGKTLSEFKEVQAVVESAGGRIGIFNNMNAGGAGGFTRGMIEVLKDKSTYNLTHVLLMDDDAVVEPDALVRIYGLLVSLKDEWKDITVGGAMLREDYPYMLFCAGERWENGAIINPQMHLDLRNFEDATDAYLMETGHEHEWYSGWWCCCYSLGTVREDNLPIPLFIHHDDIEYGLRNQEKGIVFLNGIGVWHRGAEVLFPGANIYYDTRNNLIEVALHGTADKKKIAQKLIFRALTSALIRLKYQDAYLAYQGLLDFLKGPEWLYNQDPQKLHDKVKSMACQMKAIEDVKTELTEIEFDDIQKQIGSYLSEFSIDVISDSRTRKSKATIMHYLTFNGWTLPTDRESVKVIASTDSPFDAYRKKKVVLFEPGSGKAMVTKRDYGELKKAMRLYAKATMAINRYFKTAVKSYNGDIKKITNKGAWEKYLGTTQESEIKNEI